MTDPDIQRIRSATGAVLGDVIDWLRRGVRIASVNPAIDDGPGEGTFQSFFAGVLDDLGCRVELLEPDADALAGRFPEIRSSLRTDGFRGRPNVIGWLPAAEPADDRRAHLILNSHADTVAPGDASKWPHPPHDGALADDAVWGLGAIDAKGCLFAFVGAAAALRRAGVRLRAPVLIQAVVDEEWGGGGVLECVRRGYSATAAIVGEPTALDVCPASRGATSLTLRVAGRRAHPGEGWLGVNAIRKAWYLVEALDRLRDDLDRTRMHPLWAGLPAGHVWNLMEIRGSGGGRAVPDTCEVQYGVGLIGEERSAGIRPIVENTIHAAAAADPWLRDHPPEVVWAPWSFEPAVTDPAHPAATGLVAAARDLGGAPAVRAFSAGSDSRHLTNAGGIPAMNFGPGALHLAHSPHEALPVEDLRRAVEVLALFLVRYCGRTA